MWAVIGIVLFGLLLGGAYVSAQIGSSFLGPAKWIGIVLMIAVAIGQIVASFLEERRDVLPRIVSAICNGLGSLLRNSITIVYLLCFLLDYIDGVNNHGVLSAIMNFMALPICILIVMGVLFLSGAIGVAGNMLSQRHVAGGVLHLIISILYFKGFQLLVMSRHMDDFNTLFLGYPVMKAFFMHPMSWLFGGISS